MLRGQNKCSRQGKGAHASKQVTLRELPRVLVVQLKRFHFNSGRQGRALR